jgi:hypothetical protein
MTHRLVLLTLLSSVAAQASATQVCSTSSRGLQFEAQGELASTRVVDECAASPFTDSRDCPARLKCQDDPAAPAPRVFCHTSSQGFDFHLLAGDTPAASISVVNECSTNAFTDTRECRAQLVCEAHYDGPAPLKTVVCTTVSRGIPFRAKGVGINSLSANALDQCVARTSQDDDCRAHLSCVYAEPGASGGAASPPTVEPPPQPGAWPGTPPRGWSCSLTVLTPARAIRSYDGTGPGRDEAGVAALEACMRAESPVTCQRQSSQFCQVN